MIDTTNRPCLCAACSSDIAGSPYFGFCSECGERQAVYWKDGTEIHYKRVWPQWAAIIAVVAVVALVAAFGNLW